MGWHQTNPLSNRGWFNIKMPSYQNRKSHCGDKTILRPSYLHNEISYTGKTTSLYWIRARALWVLKVTLGPGGWFNIKMPSYQNRKPHCGDKTILPPSYIHNGISYTGKTTSLYWIRAQTLSGRRTPCGIVCVGLTVARRKNSSLKIPMVLGRYCLHSARREFWYT